MESYYLPGSRSGSLVMKPTHNLVEAFPMRDGKPTSESPMYDPANPYKNRDPRFDYSIIYNGLSYTSNTGPKTPIWTYQSAGSAIPNTTSDGYVAGGYFTGYFSRKMLDENLASNTAGTTDRGWALIRYAEILLNYAEALNETGATSKAYAPLQQIRERAGILPGTDGLYGMKAGMTVEEMRNFIQNERRIELAFEDYRFNDLRRWMIAEQVLQGFNKVMIITRTGENTFTYRRLRRPGLLISEKPCTCYLFRYLRFKNATDGTKSLLLRLYPDKRSKMIALYVKHTWLPINVVTCEAATKINDGNFQCPMFIL
ncbi:RagB/SusD family nutrient uptake outer membrane protein [Niabella defluvii]|nr:RagB/SusD family nutrient uptake outer membrane protein [Niabella sp. I65]